MKTLRIIFTILSAVCLAAIYPVGVFLDFPFVLGLIAIGGSSFLLMLWCKKKQEKAEQPPAQPQGDFFHPTSQEPNQTTQDSQPADNASKNGEQPDEQQDK